MAYKSGNPALNKNTFNDLSTDTNPMTLEGTAAKSLLLLAFCVTAGVFGWQFAANNPQTAGVYILGSIIAAFVLAIIIIFKKSWAPLLAPMYALIEGFALGGISLYYETEFGGIVLQALLLTGGIFTSMLLLYLFKVIKATENFKLGVAAATGGIFIFYLVGLVMSFFGRQVPLIASNSVYGIGFTVLVIIIAALNLVVDFDFIERGVDKKAPKYMEWYASFGLFVTVVWLYLEMLRLLSKLRSR